MDSHLYTRDLGFDMLQGRTFLIAKPCGSCPERPLHAGSHLIKLPWGNPGRTRCMGPIHISSTNCAADLITASVVGMSPDPPVNMNSRCINACEHTITSSVFTVWDLTIRLVLHRAAAGN